MTTASDAQVDDPQLVPPEEFALFNPAFLAYLVNRMAYGWEKVTGAGMHYSIAFLAVPVVLHGPTRRALPSTTRSNLLTWLHAHPALAEVFPTNAQSLKPYVAQAVMVGCETGLLSSDAGLLHRGNARRMPPAITSEGRECFDNAVFVGRWFGKVTPPITLFNHWGIRL